MNPRRTGALVALVVLALGIGWAVSRDSGADTDSVATGDAAASTPAADDASPNTAANTEAANATTNNNNNNDTDDAASSVAGSDATTTSATTAPATPTTSPADYLPNLGPHPELVGIEGWQQSNITSLDELDGQVYAVQFWTFGCYNCKNTLPHLQELYAKYKDQGFEIVGVHSPEFDREAVPENIANASAELGVTWPVALDPNKESFRKWQEGGKRVWPRIFLIDRDGNIRFDHRGEGAYDEMDAAVGALLAEGV